MRFKIRKRKIFGIYGESGSGKTSLADILTGLIKINKGKILINKLPFNFSENINLKKYISYSSQNYSIFNDTILNNIIFSNPYDKKMYDKVINLANLKKIKMDKKNTKLGDRGNKLSGGQRQRLALARTIYNNSQVIIFDEPTSALDRKTEISIVKNSKKLAQNKIIIFLTHNNELKKYFDEVYIIKKSKLKKI